MENDHPGSRTSRLRRWIRGTEEPHRAAEDSEPCLCGHARDAHEHYRRGTDCALCACPRFRH